jgi:hypothetical protein
MTADIATLSSWSARWEVVDVIGVVLVLIGVIGEGLSEWPPGKLRDWPHLGKFGRISWLILVAGLAVELVAQHKKDGDDALIIASLSDHAAQLSEDVETQRAASEAAQAQIADAQARTKEAELALEKLRTPRTLNPERQKFVAEAIAPFKGQRYRVAISSGADDGLAFWESLYVTLNAAGWIYVPSTGL